MACPPAPGRRGSGATATWASRGCGSVSARSAAPSWSSGRTAGASGWPCACRSGRESPRDRADHPGARRGRSHGLALEHVAEASTGVEVFPLAERHRPDVVVLDISMPGESGIQVAARLRQRLPEIRVLILSMYDNAEYVLESVRAGAHGYILKDTAATELRRAIRAVQN